MTRQQVPLHPQERRPLELPPMRMDVGPAPVGRPVWNLLVSTHLWRVFWDDLVRLADAGQWVLMFGYHDGDCQHGVTGTRHLVDESPEGTMQREVHEETGLRVTGPYPPFRYIRDGWRCVRIFNVHVDSLTSSVELPPSLDKRGDMKKDKVVVTIHGPQPDMVDMARNTAAALARPGANPDHFAYIVAISARDALFTLREIERNGRGQNKVWVDLRRNPMVRRPPPPASEEPISPSKRRADSEPDGTPSPSKRGRA